MMVHNIYSSIKINLTRTRNLKTPRNDVYIVSLSSDLPSTHRGCPRGGKGAYTCTRRPELLAVELGLRGVVAGYLILHLVVAIHRESAHVTPGRWGDAAAIGLRGTTRMASGLGEVTKIVSSRLIQSGCRNAVGSGEVGTQYIGNQLLRYTHRSSRACP